MRHLAFFTLLHLGCTGGELPDSVQVQETTIGDTVVMLSMGVPPVVEGGPVRTVWQSEELERPTTMVSVGEALLIGDHTRIHLLPMTGGPAVTFGRDGEGPGEFRSISSVGRIDSDTLLVFDVRLHRLSYLDPLGNVLRMVRVTTTQPFVNPSRNGEPLVLMGGEVLWTRGENAYTSRRGRVALIRHDLSADSATVLQVWDDVQYRTSGQYLTTTEVFPPRAIYALSEDGRVAAGDGQDYCILLTSVEGPDLIRACREWERARPGQGIRAPDYSVLDDQPLQEVLQELGRLQDVGERMPSYDRLWFADEGDLWVRTVGEEVSGVHPAILFQRPDLGPPQRAWDVFDRGGRLEQTVRMPSGFDPRVFSGNRVFGFQELATGEVVIGEVTVGEAVSQQ